jgi:hypothetical protein
MCPPFLYCSLLPCVIQEWVLSASQNKANFNVVAPNFKPHHDQQLPQPQPLGKAVCSHLKHSTPSDGGFHASAGGARVCCASAVPQCAPMVMLMDTTCTLVELHPSRAFAARRAALGHGDY